jgi:hypothetical protein
LDLVIRQILMNIGDRLPPIAKALAASHALLANANGLTMDEQKVKNGAKRKKLPHEKVKLTERSMKHAYDDQKSLQGRKFVAEKY